MSLLRSNEKKDLQEKEKIDEFPSNREFIFSSMYDKILALDSSFYFYYMKLRGQVIKGAGLGYKTANLKITQQFNLAKGVYLAKVTWQKKNYPAMAIMGVRPDLEVYLLDFEGDLYNQTLEVEVLGKMRGLIKFEKEEELLRQIKKDIREAKEYFNNAD